MLEPAVLVGSTLRSVISSWEVTGEARASVPTHVWLDLSEAGLIQIVTDGPGLELVHQEPYAGYSMGDQGRVEIETDDGTIPVEGFTGSVVIDVRSLNRGFVVGFASGSVAFANIADEIAIGLWPDQGWADRGVE